MELTSGSTRDTWLTRVLEVYRYKFLRKPVETLCRTVLRDNDLYHQLRQSMRLVLYDDDGATNEEVQRSLVGRVPIHFGKDTTHLYSAPKYQRTIMNDSKLPPLPASGPHPRYAVCGPSWMRNMQKIWVVHLWGINLESDKTTDYTRFMSLPKAESRDVSTVPAEKKTSRPRSSAPGSGRGKSKHQQHQQQHVPRLKRKLYRMNISHMIYGILEGALASNYAGDIIVNVPMVGLGSSLKAVQHEGDKEYAKKVFFAEILRVMKEERYSSKLWLRVCLRDDYSTPDTQKLNKLPRVMVENRSDIFHLPLASVGGLSTDIFHNTKFGHKTQFKVKAPHLRQHSQLPPLQCLVNAWNSRSWIGNGGTKDNTLDGKLVSGAGDGSKLPNTSYLHNCFITPTILYPSYWTRMAWEHIGNTPEHSVSLPSSSSS